MRHQVAAFHQPGRPQLPISSALEAISDPGLRACIEDFQSTAKRYYAGEITELDCADRNIFDLEGMQSFPYLRSLKISENPVSDLAPLAELKHLVSLRANNIGVADLEPNFSWLSGIFALPARIECGYLPTLETDGGLQ